MDSSLDAAQQAVVDHPSGSPLVVTGGFGAGASTALQARVKRLEANGSRPLVVSLSDSAGFLGWALDLLRRQGQAVEMAEPEALLELITSLTERPAAESLAAVSAFHASFLGDEELRTHAVAAGTAADAAAEEVIALHHAYRAALTERGLVDDAGALVAASMALRDPAVLASERAAFDELIVDDFQLATFADARVVAQLAGQGGPVTVAGNPAAAVSDDPLSAAAHLGGFARRFTAAHIPLPGSHRRPEPPTLRIVLDEDEVAEIIDDEMAAGDGMILNRGRAPQAVGSEAATVVVYDATEGRWPAPLPAPGWFDLELLHGPDVPDASTRHAGWLAAERRRFGVVCSRATRRLVVLAELPVSPFIADLVH